MKTMYDIQQLLKQYGIFIYTRNRGNDLELMEEEIRELYTMELVDVKTYQQALLILRQEKRENTVIKGD
ncbi:YqgQ family protein [Bacillus sp. FJAT-45350]|uniref:YqgQ family protein n=1 Tax=Bacillus sp. FJAT-45350 TaxID=2011014 RepID=UPI000BB72E5A|nr:YqgQ family protein [Bacillus sp. FJAT-45350]